MKIRGMIFDMDGVVVDSMVMWRGLEPRLEAELGIDIDEETSNLVQTMSLDISTVFLIEKFGLDMTAEELSKYVYGIIEDYYLNRSELKEGAADILTKLSAAGKKITLATATPRKLTEAALSKNDVLQYFGKIYTVSEIGKGKGEPAIFETAMEWIGGPNGETMVVEDSPVAIKTAKNAGFKVCAVYDGINDETLDEVAEYADLKIRSLTELDVIL